jgi:glycosyltransferase involved in cell wall biosynthesis
MLESAAAAAPLLPAPASAPTISVLLPFWNAEAHLAECLASLRAQTCADFEIVAVDDGSTDGSAAIAAARAVEEPRLRIVTRPHRGLVAALNAGLTECRGTWVARMDADDVALPTRLERQLAWARAHPEQGLLGCLAEPFASGGRLSVGGARYHAWMNALRDDAAMKAALLVESPIPHPAFFARRALFQRLWGYRERPWPEDYDLLLRAAAAGVVFGKVPEVLVRRRDHPGRLTRSDVRYRRDAMFRAKVHHFVRGPWLQGAEGGPRREVVLGGSGNSARKVAALLRAEGVTVRCLLDNKGGPPGRRVHGIPATGYPDAIPPAFFAEHRDAFFVSCIGQEEGRARLVRHLEANGLRQGRDWLLFL